MRNNIYKWKTALKGVIFVVLATQSFQTLKSIIIYVLLVGQLSRTNSIALVFLFGECIQKDIA